MLIKKGDKVQIIAGKDLGKIGVVLKMIPAENRLLVEGVNVVKKHVKAKDKKKEGGIIKKESPIHISNVMYYDSDLKRPVRLGSKIVDGKKYRYNRVKKEVIEK